MNFSNVSVIFLILQIHLSWFTSGGLNDGSTDLSKGMKMEISDQMIATLD